MSIQSISTSLPPPSNLEASSVSREAKAISAPTQDDAQAAQTVSSEQLKSAVQSVKDFIGTINNNLEFSVSDETHQVVVKIVDSSTKEVIRQIPSEEMLVIAKALDSLKGIFVKQTA